VQCRNTDVESCYGKPQHLCFYIALLGTINDENFVRTRYGQFQIVCYTYMFILKQCISSEWIASSVRGPYCAAYIVCSRVASSVLFESGVALSLVRKEFENTDY
jgi:hypothetical protein